MKKLIVPSLIIFLLLPVSCGESAVSMMDPDGGSTSSTGHDNPGDAVQCHGNMRLLDTGVKMFYGLNCRFPDDLSELAMVDPKLCNLICPSCELPYLYDLSSSGEVYTITCPIPSLPNHGYIQNGHSFWPPDPPAWPQVCRSNMMSLATGCSIFYGIYSRFPEKLEELGTSGIYEYWDTPCPACGELYVYNTSSTGDSYEIYCPMPVLPNHGCVIDGVCSWPPDTSEHQEACRSNMRSLGTGCAIFYGMYNRFPEELKELGSSGVMGNWDLVCPTCGELYSYYSDPAGTTYVIQCPLPWFPGHGSIENGITSWD